MKIKKEQMVHVLGFAYWLQEKFSIKAEREKYESIKSAQEKLLYLNNRFLEYRKKYPEELTGFSFHANIFIDQLKF